MPRGVRRSRSCAKTVSAADRSGRWAAGGARWSRSSTTTCSPPRLGFGDTPPYEPAIRDGRLYARGVCDNKGELLHDPGGRGVARRHRRCRAGSASLSRARRRATASTSGATPLQRPEFFEGHGALIEGGGVDEKGRPTLACGVRGMVYAELSVRTLWPSMPIRVARSCCRTLPGG